MGAKGQSTTREAARQASIQAEYERRKGILSLIEKRQKEKAECEALTASFQGLLSQTAELSAEMQAKSSQYYAPVPEDFGGVTAISADKGIRTALNAVSFQAMDLSEVCSALGEQIGLLNTYISNLDVETEGLMRSL